MRLASGEEDRLAGLHSPHVVKEERIEDADATLELVRERERKIDHAEFLQACSLCTNAPPVIMTVTTTSQSASRASGADISAFAVP